MAKGKRTPRERNTFLAKVADEAGRYPDVIAEIKAVIPSSNGRLNADERSLLAVAYKNITGNLRSSLRVMDAAEQSARRHAQQREVILIRAQRKRIEQELVKTCDGIVKLLDERLIPSAAPGEEMVFYYKTKADYHRYAAELSDEQSRTAAGISALEAYKHAYKHALATLDAAHPTRLGLALNFAVYYHDIYRSPERACHLAKHAFDEGVSALDNVSDEGLRDALMILQLLRDDMLLWAEEMYEL